MFLAADTITLGEALSNPLIIVAIISASLGIACVMLAKKVAGVVTKKSDVKPDDKVLIGMKIAGLVLIMIGFVFMFIWGALGIPELA